MIKPDECGIFTPEQDTLYKELEDQIDFVLRRNYDPISQNEVHVTTPALRTILTVKRFDGPALQVLDRLVCRYRDAGWRVAVDVRKYSITMKGKQ